MSKSRWVERGPGHLRTDGKGRPKAEPGSHNRRARRAAKATQTPLFPEPSDEERQLRALWEAFGRHHERTRPEREARSAAFTVEQYDNENETLPPKHLNITELLRRVEQQHQRLRGSDFAQRQVEAYLLAWEIAALGGWLADQDVVIDSKKGRAENDQAGNALAAALAIGSLQPGGIKLWSMWFESVDGALQIRFLVDPANPWLEVSECA